MNTLPRIPYPKEIRERVEAAMMHLSITTRANPSVYTVYLAPDVHSMFQMATYYDQVDPRIAGLPAKIDRNLNDGQIRLRHEVVV